MCATAIFPARGQGRRHILRLLLRLETHGPQIIEYPIHGLFEIKAILEENTRRSARWSAARPIIDVHELHRPGPREVDPRKGFFSELEPTFDFWFDAHSAVNHRLRVLHELVGRLDVLEITRRLVIDDTSPWKIQQVDETDDGHRRVRRLQRETILNTLDGDLVRRRQVHEPRDRDGVRGNRTTFQVRLNLRVDFLTL